MSPSNTRPEVRAIRGTAATNVSLGIFGVATGALSARLLGPSGRGDLALIQLWPTLLAIIAMLGIPEALVFFSARDRGRAGRLLGAGVAIAAGSSCLFIAVGWFALPVILRSHPHSLVLADQRYLLVIPLYAVTLVPTHPLRGIGAFGWWNTLRLGPALAWLAVLLIAFPLGINDPRKLAYANLFAMLSVGIVAIVVVVRRIPPPYRPSHAQARALMAYGIPAFGATLPQLLNLRLDQLVMTAVLGSRDLGLYVVAVAWSTATMPILVALGQVVFPRLASEHEPEARMRAFAAASRNAVALSILFVTAISVVTPALMPVLLSSRFKPAVRPAVILVLAGGVYGYGYVLAEGIRGLGRPVVTLCAELAGLVVTGIGLALLLPPFGLTGAALSSLFGYSAVTGWYWVFLRRQRMVTRWEDWLLPRRGEFMGYARQLLRAKA